MPYAPCFLRPHELPVIALRGRSSLSVHYAGRLFAPQWWYAVLTADGPNVQKDRTKMPAVNSHGFIRIGDATARAKEIAAAHHAQRRVEVDRPSAGAAPSRGAWNPAMAGTRPT